MKIKLIKKVRILICFSFLLISFTVVKAQNIYIDTVTYEGTLKFKSAEIHYKRIKSVVGSLNNNFKVFDPELRNPIDETLLLFDKDNKCILTFKLNEVVADHNNATIMRTECNFTDTSLKLTRYSFFTDNCGGCSGTEVGLEKFNYALNSDNILFLKDSFSVTTNNPKEKLKISKSEIIKFKQALKNYSFLSEFDRQKIFKYFK